MFWSKPRGARAPLASGPAFGFVGLFCVAFLSGCGSGASSSRAATARAESSEMCASAEERDDVAFLLVAPGPTYMVWSRTGERIAFAELDIGLDGAKDALGDVPLLVTHGPRRGLPREPEATLREIAVTARARGWTDVGVCPERPGEERQAQGAVSRREVVRAMDAVAPAVDACSNREGLVPIRIVFAGRDGTVTEVEVTDAATEIERECVERAVRAARLAPFGQPQFAVNFPFRVRAEP